MKRTHTFVKFVFVVVAAAFILMSTIAFLHSHNCAGDSCPVCQIVEKRIFELFIVAVFSLCALCPRLSLIKIELNNLRINKFDGSLVAKRVKITS